MKRNERIKDSENIQMSKSVLNCTTYSIMFKKQQNKTKQNKYKNKHKQKTRAVLGFRGFRVSRFVMSFVRIG